MWQLLADAGLVPDDVSPGLVQTNTVQDADSSLNVSDTIIQLWHESSLPAPAWLPAFKQRIANGFRLQRTPERATAWLGRRLLWRPPTSGDGRTIGVVSSRLRRNLEDYPEWFAALRTVCGNAARQNTTLISVATTTTSRFIRHAAAMFGTNWIDVTLPKPREAISDWLARSVAEANPATISLSNVIGENCISELESVQLADRVAFSLSGQVVAIHVRQNSATEMLIRHRLNDPAFATGSLLVAANGELIEQNLRRNLLDAGAVGWFLISNESKQQVSCMPGGAKFRAAPIISMPSETNWPWLAHCTRRRHGPWPDQSEDCYRDDLILGHCSANHSALAELCRIVSQQRLIASGESIRGAFPVVSFTELPLSQIAQRRVFRPHRGRWDFEPYGLCVRRDWLIAQGAEPVVYGTESDWEALPPHRQAFFQLCQTKSGTTDWTTEIEWRVTGTLDFSHLPTDAGIVFAPTDEEAHHLATISRWPVTVIQR